MAEQPNAKCAICGKPYKVCRSCKENMSFTPWRTVTDSVEHYKIYLAVHSYSVAKNKDKAYALLNECDITGYESFEPAIRNVISEILAYGRPQETKKKVKFKVPTQSKPLDTDDSK